VLLVDRTKGHAALPTTEKGNVQRNDVEKRFASELKEGEGACDPALATLLADCLSADTLQALDEASLFSEFETKTACPPTPPPPPPRPSFALPCLSSAAR
jgi:hypothetical protein